MYPLDEEYADSTHHFLVRANVRKSISQITHSKIVVPGTIVWIRVIVNAASY